ncbi:MAG: YhdH/YhfP family quinone oxidoreductase [Pseudomonadota bacterium]|nr:YhdH/YhfP family quinone oxidoreductase [Pseudomonadota bacterium]
MQITQPFLAYRIGRTDEKISGQLQRITLNDISPGDITIRVHYSDINYKDALAATGAAPILRHFPLVGGIDLSGEVVESTDKRFNIGDLVLVLGCELSENRDGGYAEYARVTADSPVAIPHGLDTRSVMAIGTAGFTTALAIHRMEINGQNPDLGPILVTGATGGVGSFAVDMLSSKGYEVHALTGKPSKRDYLERLGAYKVIDRNELKIGEKPLESARWAGAIDNLGGDFLAHITRSIKPWGNIASVGLASSPELRTTVMPFILRSVSILGINMSVSRELKIELWNRLASDLKPRHLEEIITREVSLLDLPQAFNAFIAGKITGRTVVKIK